MDLKDWFKPDKLLVLYRRYWLIAFVIVYLPSVIGPFFNSLIAGIAVLGSLTLLFGFIYWWIGAFYETVYYRVTDEDIEYKRGVWFKQRTEVPYSRITNVGAKQGPVQRSVGCGQIDIQTAGSSEKTGAELKIKGVENYEKMQEKIVGNIKGGKTSPAAETFEGEGGGAEGVNKDILEELKGIRKILEEK